MGMQAVWTPHHTDYGNNIPCFEDVTSFVVYSHGRLLIIAPKMPFKGSFREKCMEMNKLAEVIAKDDFRTSSSHG